MATSEEWRGQMGLEWSRRTEALDRLLGPAGREGLRVLAPKSGERVLDLGCGVGVSTEALADMVGPSGHVTGVDISPDLVAAARERLADHDNVTLLETDAGSHDLGEGAFDALYSRFGMMFFDDPPAAFANLRRALRPGGRVVLLAWRDPGRNLWATVPMSFVAEEMSGQSAGATGPGPFAWAETAAFRPLLERAGFRDLTLETFEYSAEIADGDDPDPIGRALAFMTRIGPLASRLREAPEFSRREAESFIARRLQRHVKNGAVRLLASAWVIEARV